MKLYKLLYIISLIFTLGWMAILFLYSLISIIFNLEENPRVLLPSIIIMEVLFISLIPIFLFHEWKTKIGMDKYYLSNDNVIIKYLLINDFYFKNGIYKLKITPFSFLNVFLKEDNIYIYYSTVIGILKMKPSTTFNHFLYKNHYKPKKKLIRSLLKYLDENHNNLHGANSLKPLVSSPHPTGSVR